MSRIMINCEIVVMKTSKAHIMRSRVALNSDTINIDFLSYRIKLRNNLN